MLLMSGCCYIRNRCLDLADCVDVMVGAGAGVGGDVWLSPYAGCGYGIGTMWMWGKWKRATGTARNTFVLLVPAPLPLISMVTQYRDDFEPFDGDFLGHETRYEMVRFLIVNYPFHGGSGAVPRLTNSALQNCLAVLYCDVNLYMGFLSLRVRVHLGEIVDFLAGLFGLDPMQDDVKMKK